MSDNGGTVVVIGGGGHAKVLISIIRKLPWTIAGYVDPRDVGPVLGVPHVGGDDVLPALLARHPAVPRPSAWAKWTRRRAVP